MFSDAAMMFVGDHMWLVLSVAYQAGSYLWQYSQSRSSPPNPNPGPSPSPGPSPGPGPGLSPQSTNETYATSSNFNRAPSRERRVFPIEVPLDRRRANVCFNLSKDLTQRAIFFICF